MNAWTKATARWRELTEQAEQLEKARDAAWAERRFGDALDLSAEVRKAYRERLLLTGRTERPLERVRSDGC